MQHNLPEQTVERLSQYRRVLLNYQYLEHAFIFSHNLARVLKTKPATVRRDFMLIGVTGDVHKGYSISELINKIGDAIDDDQPEKMCFVGIGHLGKAVSEYFTSDDKKLKVAASFYFDMTHPLLNDVPCYSITQLSEVIKQEKILICALAVPREFAKEISMILVNAGIIGILNFTSVQLQVPAYVYVENYDMIAKLEKIAYFMKVKR
jgi:redox-sensing transcriptional repressor